MESNEQSFWIARKGWILSIAIPFVCLFIVGASCGWWLIDKDSGKYRASFSQEQPLSDYLYPTFMTGFAFGVVGVILGAGSYGFYCLVRKKRNSH